jgi:NAD(P)-dependent dehydrogenase (short-subunit alcohol dehydrogenase family)
MGFATADMRRVPDVELRDRVAIVTGASRGIGRELAVALARQGMKVVVAARTVEPHSRLVGSVGETVALIEADGGQALAVACDLADAEQLRGLVDQAVTHFGAIDVLVNNAADTQGSAAAVDEYPMESWRRQFDVNVHAPFVLAGLVVPHLRLRGGGVIVNITSSQGDLQEPVESPGDGPIRLGTLLGYATTKAALNRLGNALAPTLRAENIAVVNLDPGFTRTQHVELLGERGLVDAEAAAPMSATADALLRVLTASDVLRWSGAIVRVQSPEGDAT